jgi:hypothetical protein
LNYVKKYVLLYMSGLEYWRIKIIRRLRVLPFIFGNQVKIIIRLLKKRF